MSDIIQTGSLATIGCTAVNVAADTVFTWVGVTGTETTSKYQHWHYRLYSSERCCGHGLYMGRGDWH